MLETDEKLKNCYYEAIDAIEKRRTYINEKVEEIIDVWLDLLSDKESTVIEMCKLLKQTSGCLDERLFWIGGNLAFLLQTSVSETEEYHYFNIKVPYHKNLMLSDNESEFISICIQFSTKALSQREGIKVNVYKSGKSCDGSEDKILDFCVNTLDSFSYTQSTELQKRLPMKECQEIFDILLNISKVCASEFDKLVQIVVNLSSEYINNIKNFLNKVDKEV